MPCVVISAQAARVARLLAAESETREILLRIWGQEPGAWEHQAQHFLMRRAHDPLAIVLPTSRATAPTGFWSQPAHHLLALEPARREEDVLTAFLREHGEQVPARTR